MRRHFMDGNDLQKASFDFGVNDSHLNPIKDKVEAWVKNGWKHWEEEKPEWFTDEFMASVPEYTIPKKNARDEEGAEVKEEKMDVVVTVEDAQAIVARALSTL